MIHLSLSPQRALSLILMIVLVSAVRADEARSPVSAHFSFDTMDFLRDDYSATYKDLSVEQRELKLMPGPFGQALLNGFQYLQADFDAQPMTLKDTDTMLEVVGHHRFQLWKPGPYTDRPLHLGRMQPYYWGTGKLKTDSGTVAFWAKGRRVEPGYLFFQASSSFGRFEKYLLAIQLDADGSLEAFIRDARYDTHRIKSAPGLWREDKYNHIALCWDRAQGLSLDLNGRVVASNWGQDAWWTTQMPGLFTLPMAGFAQNELWIFDRPLEQAEIQRLMRTNHPPVAGRWSAKMNKKADQRLKNALLGSSGAASLPTLKPASDGRATVFEELYPLWAGDGCVKAPHVMDGKYELAWPPDYTCFSNVIGDSDFHPERVTFHLPEGSRVNYVTLEGNLTDARMLAGREPDKNASSEVFAVPNEGQFFHGRMIKPNTSREFTIPFVKSWGSPPGYAPGLHWPLTGDIRIHEAEFFNVNEHDAATTAGATRRLSLTAETATPGDGRLGYAMRALNDARGSAIWELTAANAPGSTRWMAVQPFTRLNLLTEPFVQSAALKAINLNLRLRRVREGEAMIVRLHDSGLPARTWTQIVFRLEGFGRVGGVLPLRLKMTDLRVAAGDRVWLDVTLTSSGELAAGGPEGSTVLLETAPLAEASPQYAEKAIQPALLDYQNIYYWYYPWKMNGVKPDAERPVTFGGWYDIVNYPLSILRVAPDDNLSRVLKNLALVDDTVKPGFTYDAWENAPRYWPPLPVAKADNSPDWAFFMNYYLVRFREIVHWWADRQNPDGQVGGGWNDDPRFALKLASPMLYLGDVKARAMFDRIYQGVEQAGIFRDGYCVVSPRDDIHVEDFVRHRYEEILFAPGDPERMLKALRIAWRFGKPEQTPVNYYEGKPYKYHYDVMKWYWGQTPAYVEYKATREQVTAKMKELAPAMNDVIRFRYTEAGQFSDGANMPGCFEVRALVTGGTAGPYLPALSLAAGWEDGFGPEIPRWIEFASDTRLIAHLYSYDAEQREVRLRPLRLHKGLYRITLAGEGNDADKGIYFQQTRPLKRLDEITLPVPPAHELALTIEQIQPLPAAAVLPDLIVDGLELKDGQIHARVLNIGPAPVPAVKVRLENGAGQCLAEQNVRDLKSAEDFVPGQAEVTFPLSGPVSHEYRIVADPDEAVEEIMETNNQASLKIP